MKFECYICGKAFKKFPSERKYNRKFCSRQCYNRWKDTPEYKAMVSEKSKKRWADSEYKKRVTRKIWESKHLPANCEEHGIENSAMIQKNSRELHAKLVLEETKKLEQQGFRAIPLIKVYPDIIAIKNGKVYAVEVEAPHSSSRMTAKYDKYDDIKWYDDILRILYKRVMRFTKWGKEK